MNLRDAIKYALYAIQMEMEADVTLDDYTVEEMAQRNRNLEAAHETLYEFLAALPKED